MRASKARGGFTLFEVLLVVMVLGILSGLVVGGFYNVVPAAREAAALNKARIVNAARLTYAMTVPDAPANWAAAASETDKAALLVNSGSLSGHASDWLSSAGGYTLSLAGELRARTVLRDRAGSNLNYTD